MMKQRGGVFDGDDERGKHVPPNKTSQKAIDKVKEHIESFPVVEGHYTRNDSNRKYLGAELNITRMYQLYLEEYKGQLSEKDIVSQAVYRKVFNGQYNYSFHVPKKDQCSVCINYHKAKEEGKLSENLKEEYDQHQARTRCCTLRRAKYTPTLP